MKKINCLICKQSDSLKFKEWNNFIIYVCNVCKLNFCSDLIEKQGESSPVDDFGIKMMANSFYTTNRIANSYAIKRTNIYEKFLNKKLKNILDVGCGPGVFYDPYKKLNVNWTGIEVNPFWTNFGRKNKIPILNKKINEFEKNSFDVVTAHQVLEHVENPVKFLNQIVQILKPGGILHFEIPNNLSLTSTLRKISPRLTHDYGFIQPPMHMRAYSKKTLRILFDRCNLNTKDIFTCSNINSIWGQVRSYSSFQKFKYSITGILKMGSLIIGIAKKKNV